MLTSLYGVAISSSRLNTRPGSLIWGNSSSSLSLDPQATANTAKEGISRAKIVGNFFCMGIDVRAYMKIPRVMNYPKSIDGFSLVRTPC